MTGLSSATSTCPENEGRAASGAGELDVVSGLVPPRTSASVFCSSPARTLEKNGYEVVIVTNGEEAVAAVARERFDAVLMDVQMPVMNGFEATAAIRLREAGDGTHVPVVAMTAHAMKGDRERCLEAGMDEYLCKPIDARLLVELVGRVTSAGTRTNVA